jgi:hypothetical protein
VTSAKYAKPYSAEDRAPKSVVFDLLTPPTAAEPDVHPALVSRHADNAHMIMERDTSVMSGEQYSGEANRVNQRPVTPWAGPL